MRNSYVLILFQWRYTDNPFFFLITISGPFYLAIHKKKKKKLFPTHEVCFNFNYKLLSPYLAPVFKNYTKLLKPPLIRINPFQKHFFFRSSSAIYLPHQQVSLYWLNRRKKTYDWINNSNYF